MATVRATKPPLWRDIRVLRVAGQIVFVIVLAVVFADLWDNLTANLDRQRVSTSFDFLDSRAGFPIQEGIEYSPNDTYTRAFIVGVVNTLRVAIPGMLLASILGLVIGVARLSTNWLVRKIAQVYVETLRNTPVLVVITIMFVGVFLGILPRIENSFEIPGIGFLSVRGLAVTWARAGAGLWIWVAILLVAAVTFYFLRRWRRRVNEATGQPGHEFLYPAGAFLAIAIVGFVVTGGPLTLDTPAIEERGFAYEGGLQLTIQLGALLIALVLYTAAFIAEVVRGSIQAVAKGQKEAAEALGLTPIQQLRFVVLPQALRIAIPPLNSQYLNLTKNTSLGVFIGYAEFSSVSKTAINQSARSYQIILILLGGYLLMSLIISFVMNLINRFVTVKGERR